MPAFLRNLYFWVLVAIACGIALGVAAPDVAKQLSPLSEGFVKLVRMTIAPLVFCTVVVGIAGMKDLKAVGKVGGLALLYFELMSTVALVIGLVVVNLVKPGAGMHIDISTLDPHQLDNYTKPGALDSTADFLLHVIPETFVGALTSGDLLPVLCLAILFGFALQKTGERGAPILDLVERFGKVIFTMIGMIMKVAPIGAFGAMAFTVGKYGAHTLEDLALLLACFYLTCIVFVLGVLGLVARLAGFSILRFLAYIRDELLIVLGTSSSEAVLSRMIDKLERLGVSRPVVDLVVPTGYSFNLDGTAIYLTMAAVFVAQATGHPLDLAHQLELLGILLLTSKGAAGVSGSGFIVLAATLQTVGHIPVVGLAVILGIDKFMSEARALTNVCGNGVATLVVARWCGALDEKKLQGELENVDRGGAASSPG